MGVSKRNPWLSGLGVLLTVLAINAGRVRADVTSDTPGSIVIFPKVIADGTRDTLIQLTNTSNMAEGAHCWYFDGTDDCRPINFFIDLTPQQPIAWRASTGRFAGEQRCTEGNHAVCASNADCTPPAGGNCVATPGIFLGNVPPRINFQGELKCIQVDVSGVPLGRNSLKGEALLETLTGDGAGQVSQYNAIAIQAKPGQNPSPTCSGGPFAGDKCAGASNCCDASGNCGTCNVRLKLDNTTYNACPEDLVVTHYAQGATDIFTGATVTSEITLVTCTEDIENDRPTDDNSPLVNPSLLVFNETENSTSASIPFTCWVNLRLDNPLVFANYDASTIGTFVQTRLRTGSGANRGVLAVLEEFHSLGSETASAAVNVHTQGVRSGGDEIIVPQQAGSN